MRLIHLSDLHVTDGPRLDDHLDTLDRVVSRGIELRPDCWLLTGDLYGHTVPHRSTPRERAVVYPAVARMARVAPVVIVYGNHDFDPDLDTLAELGGKWPVQVVKRARVLNLATPSGALNVYGLPYPTKRWLLAGKSVPPGVAAAQDMVQSALDSLFSVWATRIQAERQQRLGEPHVFAGHVQVRGSTIGSGVVLAGQEIEILAEQLERPAFDYGALGHLHDRQEAAPRCYYSGSLWHTSHSSAAMPARSATVVDLGSPAAGSAPIPNLHTMSGGNGQTLHAAIGTIPSGCRGFLTLEYRWAELDDGSIGWTRNDLDGVIDAASLVHGAEVRARLTVPAQHVAGCPWDHELERLRQLGASRVVAERVIEPVLRVRAPEVAEAIELPDKVRAYWRTLGTAPADAEADAALQCLSELREQDDDQVTANTSAMLA
jgi:exonuclease SbcD